MCVYVCACVGKRTTTSFVEHLQIICNQSE